MEFLSSSVRVRSHLSAIITLQAAWESAPEQ